MSSHFSYECRCAQCDTEGVVFWGEGGGRDQHEWISEIWGEFKELPPVNDWAGGRQRGEIVCRRCGAPTIDGADSFNTPDEERRRWCRG